MVTIGAREFAMTTALWMNRSGATKPNTAAFARPRSDFPPFEFTDLRIVFFSD